MANTKAGAPAQEYNIWDDKVTFKIPKTRELKDDVRIIVNGRVFTIQRGVWVDLPRPVFEVLVDKENAEAARDEYIEEHETKDTDNN